MVKGWFVKRDCLDPTQSTQPREKHFFPSDALIRQKVRVVKNCL